MDAEMPSVKDEAGARQSSWGVGGVTNHSLIAGLGHQLVKLLRRQWGSERGD